MKLLAGLGAAGFLLLVVLAGVMSTEQAATRHWKQFRIRAMRRVTEFKSLPGPARIAGVTGEGTSWTDYEPAFAKLKALAPESKTALSGTADYDAKADAALAAKTVAEHADVLTALRTGARRADGVLPNALAKGWSGPIDVGGIPIAAHLLAASAREKRSRNEMAGAIDDVAIALQVGLDAACAPPLISTAVGVAAIRAALREASEIAKAPATASGDRRRLAALVSALDRALPTLHRALLGEVCFCDVTAAQQAAQGVAGPYYLFSARLFMNDASSTWELIENAARDAESRPSADVLAAMQAAFGAAEKSSLIAIPNVARFDDLLRVARAQSRLIGAALRLRDGGSPGGEGWPVDPFTLKPLGHRMDGQIAVIWSSGPAGPGTGVGEWQPANDAKSDIVLQVVK